MRVTDDSEAQEFREWLLEIGHGRNSDEDGKIKIPQDIRSNDIDSLMNFIFSEINQNLWVRAIAQRGIYESLHQENSNLTYLY